MKEKTTRRSLLLVSAILALLLGIGFNASDKGIRWFWTDVPWMGVILVLAATVLGVLHFLGRSRVRSRPGEEVKGGRGGSEFRALGPANDFAECRESRAGKTRSRACPCRWCWWSWYAYRSVPCCRWRGSHRTCG